MKNHSDKAAFNDILFQYKHRAKKKNLIFNLSEKEFRQLTSDRCHYCNAEPKQNMNRKHSNPKYKNEMRFKVEYIYNGIDRIDSNKGYILENCVPCCGSCNLIKNNILSYDETKIVIKALLEYRSKTNG